MKNTTPVTKDPVCGMTVDPTTALHSERDGKTFYFCSKTCQGKFASSKADAKPGAKLGTKPEQASGGCCS